LVLSVRAEDIAEEFPVVPADAEALDAARMLAQHLPRHLLDVPSEVRTTPSSRPPPRGRDTSAGQDGNALDMVGERERVEHSDLLHRIAVIAIQTHITCE
jgi:hypothetical protein